MDSKGLEITRKIENGLYFREAQEWYFLKHVYPITQRSFLVIVAFFLLVVASLAALNIKTVEGGTVELPITYYTEDPLTQLPEVYSIAEEGASAQETISKYYIELYVKNREEYSYFTRSGQNLKDNFKRIKSMSTRKVTNEYQNYMSVLNQYSPIVRYGEKISRKIRIKRVNFLDGDPKSGKANVVFESIEYLARKKGKQKRSLWKSEIEFKLPVIETVIRTNSPLRFLVKYYRAKPIK